MNLLYPHSQRAALMVKTNKTAESDGEEGANVASIAMSKELYHIIARTQAATKQDLEITSDSSDARILSGARDTREKAALQGRRYGRGEKQISDPQMAA